ncbi:hypothetical protein ACTWQD_14710 [Pseudarthrobacter sp. 1C304]
MTKSVFRPVANAPGAFTSGFFDSRQGDGFRAMVHDQMELLAAEGKTPDFVASGTVNSGHLALALTLWGIWDAVRDLASRAWDAISDVLTNEGGSGGGGGGGGGVRAMVSLAEAKIVAATRVPALV